MNQQDYGMKIAEAVWKACKQSQIYSLAIEGIDLAAIVASVPVPTTEGKLIDRMQLVKLLEQRTRDLDDLLVFLREIESVKPETKDLWIHTVKCKAGALLAKVKGGAA